jgi:N-acetylglucosamine-6-phosphate deacetylase
MITLAPEICSKEIIQLIREASIVISAGHSNARYDEAKKGFSQGISAVTHLFNAMSPLQHRAPGLVGAAMDDDSVMASIIADGNHVEFPAIRIAKQVMRERLFAITDAVTTTSRGYYQHELAGDKYEAAGILSGSSLTMAKAVQNLVNEVGIEKGEALRMASLYPAKLLKLDHEIGRIEKGYKSKMIVLDEKMELREFL